MKKIVLVEDRPWIASDNLKELKNRGITIQTILYYVRNDTDIIEQERIVIDNMQKELNTNIENIKNMDFNRKLDEYFKRDDIFILLDLLLEDKVGLEEQISVQYALSKPDRGKGKIWLYTTGGRTLKSRLEKCFIDQTVDVLEVHQNQLTWNNEQIINIANG